MVSIFQTASLNSKRIEVSGATQASEALRFDGA